MDKWTREQLEQQYPSGSITETVDGVFRVLTDEEREAWITERVGQPSIFGLASYRKRSERNRLLSASDWTQVGDAPVDQQAWATYRQALRDLPSHPDWPNVEFPTAPEN